MFNIQQSKHLKMFMQIMKNICTFVISNILAAIFLFYFNPENKPTPNWMLYILVIS